MMFRVKRILRENGPLSTYKLFTLVSKEEKTSLPEIKETVSKMLQLGQVTDCGSVKTGYIYKLKG